MRGKCKQSIPAYGGVNYRVEHCLAQCVPFLGSIETCSIVFWTFPNYEAEMENSITTFWKWKFIFKRRLRRRRISVHPYGFLFEKACISMPLGLVCLKHAHGVQHKSQRAYWLVTLTRGLPWHSHISSFFTRRVYKADRVALALW